ncbi:unnamed protein product [Ectocarpus sp. 12 AP-2014]
MTTLDRKRVNKAWEEEETEEEKPALVLDDPDVGMKAQSGSWTTVGVGATGNGGPNDGEDMDDEDASPPRRRRKRHDSSDDGGDASPPRRNPRSGRGGRTDPGDDGDASPPRRQRRRHDSSDEEDASPLRRKNPAAAAAGGRSRSSREAEDASPPRRPSRGGESREDSSPPRRNGSGGGDRGRRDAGYRSGGRNEHRQGGSGRRSREENIKDGDASPPRRTRREERHDSSSGSDGSVPRGRAGAAAGGRGRNDDASPPRRGGRRDSSTRAEEEGGGGGGKRRRRHDSPEEDGKAGGDGRVKTSSGYYAGLQSGKDFKVVEQNLKRKHDAEMKGADKSSSGQGAETVYRDKKGRKLDMLNEFMKSQDARAGKKVEEAKDQFAWGRGKVQKEEEKQWKEELENIAAEPFARTVDDTRLEEARKAEIRADDPMAAYMAKKKAKERVKSGKPLKPEYKGPQPKPNRHVQQHAVFGRFGIRPGYRWDGNDRGNGWESRIVAKGVDNNYKAELAYKWATADM